MSEEATDTKSPPAAAEGGDDEEEDLEKLQKEIERMEAEAARITKETDDLEKQKQDAGGKTEASAEKSTESKDACSIYVGQVDYGTTPEELLGHFEACGTVERVTIVCDKYTGRPKGKMNDNMHCVSFHCIILYYIPLQFGIGIGIGFGLNTSSQYALLLVLENKGFAYLEFQV